MATTGKRGGARPGAGRKKGVATAKTREIADKAASAGITPLEYMLQVLRTEPAPGLPDDQLLLHEARRMDAAKSAAPYIHPRLTAVTSENKHTVNWPTMIDEFPKHQ